MTKSDTIIGFLLRFFEIWDNCLRGGTKSSVALSWSPEQRESSGKKSHSGAMWEEFPCKTTETFFLQTKRLRCSINVILTPGYAVWTRVCSFLGGVLRFFIDHSARQGNHSARLILNFLPSRKRPWVVDHSLRLGKLGQFRRGNPLLNSYSISTTGFHV